MTASEGHQKLSDRFWAKVARKGDDECWEWNAYKNEGGYGVLGNVQGKNRKATHVAWMLTQGGFPAIGVLLCHKCDNPACVNPKHLFAGTPRDNVEDCIKKGRFPFRPAPPTHTKLRGARHPSSKITEKEVHIIRSGLKTDGEYAKEFGLARCSVNYIRLRKTWKSVP